jgi:hypothetical protein
MNKIRILCPVSIKKSLNGDSRMIMQGIASSIRKDVQGQVLVPEGGDLEYFLNFGEINFDHIKSERERLFDEGEVADHEIGYPIRAYVDKEGRLQVEFGLFEHKPICHQIYKYAKELEKIGSQKRLGLSIEAIPKEIIGDRVTKWIMTGLAITPQPVNPDTSCLIKKSLSEQEKEKNEDYQQFYDFINKQEKNMSKFKKIAELLGNKEESFTLEEIAIMEQELSKEKDRLAEGNTVQERLMKAITTELNKVSDSTLSEFKDVKESFQETALLMKSLTETVTELQKKLSEIDNTPNSKSAEFIDKGEESKTKQEKVGDEEVVEITLDGSEDAKVLYKSLLRELHADNEISDTERKQASILYSASGSVSESIIAVLKKQNINLKID